ncbi:hypothetical protein [Sporomusa sp. KB1]|uniref:hypothetical protein n=1 Tax=Sporomusa sp. KB1 TaxID=943346 RepID=UPI0011AA00B4|nr:hypothetical protein [Sporomusa sp. KB1]TWH46415.1 hypothetical protein Salpa_2401 [Sporomusa sp. KB1]
MSDTINALSGSMNDQVAPSEADMEQRLQSSTQTNSLNNSSKAYIDALFSGFDNTSGENQDQSNTVSAHTEAKFITGSTGVQINPDAPPEKKENHTIEPPKVSTQHY